MHGINELKLIKIDSSDLRRDAASQRTEKKNTEKQFAKRPQRD